MKKKFAKLTKEISEIEAEIEAVTLRKGEAEERISNTNNAISSLNEDLKLALVLDDTKKVAALEKEIAKLSDKIINRDSLLIQGLDEKIPQLEKRLSETKQDKDKTFSKLCEAWLKSEVPVYDSMAKTLMEKIKRLLVVHGLLRDIDAADIYKEIVGKAYEHLTAARIPQLSNFNRQEFISGSFRSGPDLRDKVLKEITG